MPGTVRSGSWSMKRSAPILLQHGHSVCVAPRVKAVTSDGSGHGVKVEESSRRDDNGKSRSDQKSIQYTAMTPTGYGENVGNNILHLHVKTGGEEGVPGIARVSHDNLIRDCDKNESHCRECSMIQPWTVG